MKKQPKGDFEKKTTDALLRTIISQNMVISQKLDRFLQHLVMNNETMKEWSETIKVHLALVKTIGDGTQELSKRIERFNTLIEKATRKKKGK